MKFYQAVMPTLLCIMYTTTIFGSNSIPQVIKDSSENICELIDEFCGGENTNKKKLNDKFYKQTGYLKPYSRFFDLTTFKSDPFLKSLLLPCTTIISPSLFFLSTFYLMFPKLRQARLYSRLLDLSTFTMPFKQIIKFKKLLQRNTFMKVFLFYCIISPVLPTTGFNLVLGILYKIMIFTLLAIVPISPFSPFLALSAGIRINDIITKQLSHSHLTIKHPKEIIVSQNQEKVCISNQYEVITEIRSLSDIRLAPHRTFNKKLPHADKSKKEGTGLTYLLEDGKIKIYLANEDYEPPKDKQGNRQHKHDYPGDKLRSLSTPSRVISFDVSKNIIMALDEEGSLHKLELQNRQSLYEIIHSE